VALSKAPLRKLVREELEQPLSNMGGQYSEDNGIALWTVTGNDGKYYGYGVQFDKYPLTAEGGGRFAIRFYASTSPSVLEWEKFEPYYPTKSIFGRIKSYLNADADWISFDNPDALREALDVHSERSIYAFKKCSHIEK
jgi:hypothetical protein